MHKPRLKIVNEIVPGDLIIGKKTPSDNKIWLWLEEHPIGGNTSACICLVIGVTVYNDDSDVRRLRIMSNNSIAERYALEYEKCHVP